MCNLYSLSKHISAILQMVAAMTKDDGHGRNLVVETDGNRSWGPAATYLGGGKPSTSPVHAEAIQAVGCKK